MPTLNEVIYHFHSHARYVISLKIFCNLCYELDIAKCQGGRIEVPIGEIQPCPQIIKNGTILLLRILYFIYIYHLYISIIF
jgi:hypothetical protein